MDIVEAEFQWMGFTMMGNKTWTREEGRYLKFPITDEMLRHDVVNIRVMVCRMVQPTTKMKTVNESNP